MIRRPVPTLFILALALAAWAPRAQAQRIAEVQIAPPYLRMVPGAQTQASATAYDSIGTPLNVRFRWMSSNINVAVVDSTGMLRAIAPGGALITALAEGDRGRRRGAQMTVRVLAAPGAASVTVPGVAPMAPPATAVIPSAPGMPAAPVTGVYVTPGMTPRMADSIVKASINCSEPFMNAANPMQACFDRRPRLRGPENWPAAARCGEHGQPLMLLVRVNETGQVVDVLPFTSGAPCNDFVDSSVAAARVLTFEPAQRAGQPIAAWVRMVVRGPGMPPPRGPDRPPESRPPEARSAPQPVPQPSKP